MNDPSNQPGPDDDDLQRALQIVVPDTGAPVIEEDILIEIDGSVRDRKDDDRVLARFFGICILITGLITIVPAIYYLVILSAEGQGQAVARWAYILGFLGALHVVYAIYLMQLVDFSSLEALSVFLLIVTCVYGFIGMALLLDDGNGVVARFLQIPAGLKTRATLWSGVMFGIAALGCYLLGRESIIWRRRQRTNRANVADDTSNLES